MDKFKIGIIGAGGIADVMMGAFKLATNVEVSAVTSRRLETATMFADKHNISEVYPSWQEMILSKNIDAIYVATPSNIKEEICIAAAGLGKHILAEKPFVSFSSLEKITNACRSNSVAFLDGTHFVHNPRTKQIKDNMASEIGSPKVVRSTFYYPLEDTSNIRFDVFKEPLTSVGDLGWYNIRAIVEFLDPETEILNVKASREVDNETGAIVRAGGIITYKDGKTSTFDFGFDLGVCLMDLDIIGDRGLIRLDDFVLDWKSGLGFDNKEHVLGYSLRQGMEEPKDWTYMPVQSEKPQAVIMIENFAKMATDPSGNEAIASINASLKTQKILDAVFEACDEN